MDAAADVTAALGARQCTERNEAPPAGAVSQSRIGMLLSGVLPCYNPTLMKAYGTGLRAVGSYAQIGALSFYVIVITHGTNHAIPISACMEPVTSSALSVDRQFTLGMARRIPWGRH